MPRYRLNDKALLKRQPSGRGRMIGRALLAIAIIAATLDRATAQSGDMPGLRGGALAGALLGRPPKCQALLDIRDELQKHSEAISAANQKSADVKTACGLFRKYIATEAKMLKMLEADGAACGAPAQVLPQVRGQHAKAQQLGKQVCAAAARGPAQGAPSLYEVFGTPPTPSSNEETPFLYDGLWPPNRRP
jgi:hypothetical protein